MKTTIHNTNGATSPVVLLTDETFLPEVLEAETPILVDFMPQWCGPCKRMGPIFAELAPEYTDQVKFAKLDVDVSPGVAGALHVQSIPTFMLFYRNTILAMGVGAVAPQALRDWLAEGLERLKTLPMDTAPATG